MRTYIKTTTLLGLIALMGCENAEDTVTEAGESRSALVEAPEATASPTRAVTTRTPTSARPTTSAKSGADGPETVPAHSIPSGQWEGTGAEDVLEDMSDAEVLEQAKTAEDDHDRVVALISVARRRLPGALDMMREVLFDDSLDIFVQETGLSGAVEHGGTEALPLLWEALEQHPESRIRRAAIQAIALYGEQQAKRAIESGLGDKSVEVQVAAVGALSTLMERPGIVFPYLEQYLVHPEEDVRNEAIHVLSKLPYTRAGRLLKRAWETESDPEAREGIRVEFGLWRSNYPELSAKL